MPTTTINETASEQTLSVPVKREEIRVFASYASGGITVTITGAQKLCRALTPDWQTARTNEAHGIQYFRTPYDRGYVNAPSSRPSLSDWLLAAKVLTVEDSATFTVAYPYDPESAKTAIRGILQQARELLRLLLQTYTIEGVLYASTESGGGR